MPEIDRTSEDDVQAMIERLIPDEEERLACCEALAATMRYAHQCKPSCWGVTAFPDGLRMNVSNKQVFVLGLGYGADKAHLTVETSLLEPVRAELSAQGVTFMPWGADLPSAEQATLPAMKSSVLFPLILESLLGCVHVLAERVRTQTNLARFHSPGVVAYLQSFLHEEIPEPVYLTESDEATEDESTDDEAPEGRQFWKIAPGENAFLWAECQTQGSILIGWDNVGDLLSYPDRNALNAKFAQEGHKASKANSIWAFAHEVKPGDIIVANKGNNQVLGVGIITSTYLPPQTRDNPSTISGYPHARLVDWRVTQPVTLSRAFFGQIPQTVHRIYQQKWQIIRQAYREQYPDDQNLQETLDSLIQSLRLPILHLPVLSPIPEAVKPLLQMAERTRNILLYGPPGTGKTWLVTHFATYFLLSHNVSPAKAGEYWQAVADKDGKRVKVLQAEARAGTARFWSVCEDEAGLGWTWDMLAQTGAGFFDDRGVASVPGPQEGDFVFGYRSGVKQYVALARVTQGLHTRQNERRTVQSIGLGDVVLMAQPVQLRIVQADPRVQPPSQLVEGMHKYVFALAPEEASALTEAVEAANPTALPEGFGESFLEFVTFHQSFAYEEFVEGIRPDTKPDGSITYRVRPGVFRRMCERARKQPKKRFLLIIDEINRANIAKVLGELITLIEDDKRLGEANAVQVTLPYSGEQFGVPKNLTLLGTMNTADRSIALLDLALRRRFTFVEMPPDPTLLSTDVAGVNVRALLTRLNKRVAALLDRDHQIGHSYLMDASDAEGLHFAWYHRIVPLLQEYFYHDGERLQAVLGKAFVKEVPPDPETKAALGAAYEETARFEVAWLEGEAFLAALRGLAGSIGGEVAEGGVPPPLQDGA